MKRLLTIAALVPIAVPAVRGIHDQTTARWFVPVPSNANSDLLTVDEIAARLRVKSSWVYTHANELGALRLGKHLRFSWERVLAHLERKESSLGALPNDQD